jgi:hypothetical protein
MINCKIVCIECYQSQLQLLSDFKSSRNKHVADNNNLTP